MDEHDSGRGLVEQQLEAWLKKTVFFADRELHGDCNKIVLRHLNIERKPQGDVQGFQVRAVEGDDDNLIPLLHGIADAAQKDAGDLNAGIQTYAIYAFFPKDPGYVPRKVFRVAAPDAEFERDINPSEPPTEKGLVAQTMRHLESVMKTSAVSLGYLVNSQQAEIRRLAEMNEKFSQQQVDFMVLLQDTMDTSHKRRLLEKESEVNIAMKESALSKLESLIPVIINRLAGQEVLPSEDRSFMLMAGLLENMSEEQQRTLLATLSDSQRIALSEILFEYEKKKSKFIEGQKETIRALGKKNAMPTDDGSPSGASPPKKIPASSAPAPAKRIEAAKKPSQELLPAKKPNEDLLIPENEAVPLPMFQTLRERLANPTASANRDPQLEKLEQDAAAFTSRFKDFLKPKEPGK